MKSLFVIIMGCGLLLFAIAGKTQPKYPVYKKLSGQNEVINQLSEEYMPVMGVWNMREAELNPEGYKKTLDQASRYSLSRLKDVYRKLLDTDISIKTGKMDPELALNVLVAELCRESTNRPVRTVQRI